MGNKTPDQGRDGVPAAGKTENSPRQVHLCHGPSGPVLVHPVFLPCWRTFTANGGKHQTIDAFELWCWRRLLRVPWTARRSNQSILKEISPEYSLEGQMMKLKFQNIGHLMQTTHSLEKTLMLGKIEGRRRRDKRG